MAQPAPIDDSVLIKEVLEDFGVPAQKIIQMYNIYDSCYDYMQDVKKFRENYDKFDKLQKAAISVKKTASEMKTTVDALNDDILQKDSWYSVSKINTDKMSSAEDTAKVMKSNADDLDKICGSAADATKEADEILNRRNTMRCIQLALVFKDVAFGIYKVINTSRDIKFYNAEFQDIYNKHVAPTIQSFTSNGTIDDKVVTIGLARLRMLKHNVSEKQYATQQSVITHGFNAFSTGLQAYATFNNISLLGGIASKSALALNYLIGGAQVGLTIGSLTLAGMETYNYLQYQSLIEKIEEMMKNLEEMSKSQ